MAVGLLWFRVPFNGNPLVMLLGTSFFLLSTLALGLADFHDLHHPAAGLRHQLLRRQSPFHPFRFQLSDRQHAARVAMVLLHQSLALLSRLDPACFLKGVGFSVLWPDLFALAGLGTVLLTASILRFRKSLD